jgi:endoglucanase
MDGAVSKARFRRWCLGVVVPGLIFVGCGKSAVEKAPVAAAPAAPAAAPDPKHNLLKNADFSDGSPLPWMTQFSAPARGEGTVKDGALCVTLDDKGTNKWDAQLRHREMVIQQGHSYSVDFLAWASTPTKVYPKIGMAGPPYAEYWAATLDLGTKPQRFQGQFTMGSTSDPTAEFTFHLGGVLAKQTPVTICVDDLYLNDPQFTAEDRGKGGAGFKIAVNQVGYLPNVEKVAVLANDATEPQKWKLIKEDGSVALEGETKVVGKDQNSGNFVHQIDFSAFKEPGKGYVLEAGSDKSAPFDIASDVYKKLKYDALAYFYHNRSGIEIKMPYAGEQKWTRPAGHMPDKASCFPGSGCSYTLDVSKGWYDAGDHGKYVVNGGISAWTLMNQWETLKYLGKSSADFGDGKLAIPENGNGVDDLLDEARWEVEFMIAMQVPDGNELAGMVHHKMHDEDWTAIGLRPDQDTLKRYLHAPSTAATLNTAAVAAQAARLFKKKDPAFAAKCLVSAEKAWNAAKKFPDKYATTAHQKGGGPYDDDYVTDEFYWAAAELFVTTGEHKYLEELKSNPHDEKFRRSDNKMSLFDWKNVDALGVITLAVVPSKLSNKARDKARDRLVAVADEYVKNESKEGYRTPFVPEGDGYPWGSNSFVVNNAIVLGLAYDFTKKPEYRDAVSAAMDYVLGTNPLSQSYVTGYGERPLKNPHHRFWAKQARGDFPEAPPGVLSGGPNSGLQDDYVKAAGLKGCAPQKCWTDNIEAWSVNEITINWNSPLAWVASFLDEQASK